MRDFQNAFDAALAGVDSTIVEVMGIRAQFTSGAQRGGEVQGVFDDPESLGFAGGGVRIEGSSPSLFVRTDTVRAVRRGDTLTINGEMFWVDRVSPDDGGSCYLWLNRGQPCPAVCACGVVRLRDKHAGGGAVYPLCEYFRRAGGVFSYRTGRLAAGRDAGGDCGAGPQSSRWSALAERGGPAAADKECPALVAGLPG